MKKKIRKVMLIFPPGKVLKGHFHHCEAPLGIAYLAAVLRNDFEVKIIDGRAKLQSIIPKKSKWEYYGYTIAEIGERIAEYFPDVVGISCLSSFHFPEINKLSRLIKRIDSRIITVIGGTHPTFLAQETMNRNLDIDFIVLGEAENSFLELLRAIDKGIDYSLFDGIAFRRNGNIFVNKKTKFITNLDEIPFPALDLLPLGFYEKIGVPFSVTFKYRKNAPLLTSRGCTARCVFCATRNYWGNIYRKRSADNVLSEIEVLIGKYGIKEIQFVDDNLTLDKARAKQIFRGIIEKKFNICWTAPSGLAGWTIDDEMLELMKASGCYEVCMAFESGDQNVLDTIIKKPLNLERARLLADKMKKLGIQVNGYFIAGFPGETKTQILKTFAFAKELDLDCAWFFIANPIPGSELYQLCVDNGYLKKDFSFEDIELDLPNIETEDFSGDQLERLILVEFNKYLLTLFFRHPIRFIKKFLKMIITHPVMSFRSIYADLERIFKK